MTTWHDISPDQRSTDRRIVVGIDSSEASLAALRWAVDQARVTAAQVEAVLVYQPDPYLGFAYGDYPAIMSVSPNQMREDALDELRAAVAAAVPANAAHSVKHVLLTASAPAKALTRHAVGASMLVVGGSHQHGLGTLLGSTATGCVRHAPCPVVVVPAAAAVSTPAAQQAADRLLQMS